MNCTYCFNNNIPNHYQTGNSLSTECKALYFHYDLLLKKTIFKSSILSYLPNNPGSFTGGPGASRVCKIMYATLFHHTWIDILYFRVNYCIIYLLLFSYSILYLIWHAIIEMALYSFGNLDNLGKTHSHTNVKPWVWQWALGSEL